MGDLFKCVEKAKNLKKFKLLCILFFGVIFSTFQKEDRVFASDYEYDDDLPGYNLDFGKKIHVTEENMFGATIILPQKKCKVEIEISNVITSGDYSEFNVDTYEFARKYFENDISYNSVDVTAKVGFDMDDYYIGSNQTNLVITMDLVPHSNNVIWMSSRTDCDDKKKSDMNRYFSCDIEIINVEYPESPAKKDINLKISMPKKINMFIKDFKEIKVKVYCNGELLDNYNSGLDISWKRSNKNLFIDDDMDVAVIEPRKAGQCKVTIKASYCPGLDDDLYEDDEEDYDYEDLDMKTYTASATCLVTIKKYNTLTVQGQLQSYDTRNNIFIMKIRNYSNKPITIYSSGAYVLDEDYKSFDRYVRLTGNRKTVVIKSMQTKTIKFKVIGSNTWYNVNDFELHSVWKWNGKKYVVSVDASYVYMYTNKKWKMINVGDNYYI